MSNLQNTQRATAAGHRAHQRQRGLSLIEAAVTTAVAAVITSQAVPSLNEAGARRRLEGVATQFRTDVQLARAQAIALNTPLRLEFNAQAGCYVVHAGENGQCTCSAGNSPVCTGQVEVVRHAAVDAASGLVLSSNVRALTFDPAKGTVTPAGSFRFSHAKAGAVHQVVSVMGRVRSCSPRPAVPGMPAC